MAKTPKITKQEYAQVKAENPALTDKGLCKLYNLSPSNLANAKKRWHAEAKERKVEFETAVAELPKEQQQQALEVVGDINDSLIIHMAEHVRERIKITKKLMANLNCLVDSQDWDNAESVARIINYIKLK